MIVDAFKTKEHTRKYRRETEIIKNTNSYLTIEWLYVNKITAAVVTFILSLILMFNITRIDVRAAYNRISDEFLSFGQLTEQQEAAAKAINDRDKTYVDKYKNKNVTKEQIQMEMTDPVTGKADADEVERVYGKIQDIKNSYLT